VPSTESIAEFRERVTGQWLPIFCHDARRRYPLEGFRETSIVVSVEDAHDCMYAIDRGLVVDHGGGRYWAARRTAFEQLFWTGLRTVVPRPVTLWVEPVITFAALARLHRDYGWPSELLGTQPKSWSFDLAAHMPTDPSCYRVLGEVKKTVREAEALIADLRTLSRGEGGSGTRINSRKKWSGLLAAKPSILWIVGPGGYSKVFSVAYKASAEATLGDSTADVLAFNAA
jgi:hypothetical protein